MKQFKLLTLSAIIIGLMGCSAEDQDVASSNEKQPIAVSGIVIDPNISSSIVFADYDNDGVLDAFEPWTLTDADGYFGTSKSGEDYCAKGAEHCLILANSDSVPLVAVGGYDNVTLERINTRLSRSFTGEGLQVITPLTSLSSMTVSEDFDKSIDFMSNAFTEDQSTTALQLAFNLNKMVEILTQVLIAEYPAIGEEELLPSDLSGFVFQAIDKVGSDQELVLSDFLQKHSENQISLILDDARTRIHQAYQDAGISLLATYAPPSKDSRSYAAQSYSATPEQDISDLLEQIQLLITASFELALANENIAELPRLQLGLLRQIQFTVNSAVSAIEKNADILSAVTPVIDVLNAVEDDAIMSIFGQDSYDSSFFNNKLVAVQADLTNILSEMEKRQMMPKLMGAKKLTLNETTAEEKAKITFYFDGELSGSLSACVYYQDLTDATNINNTQGTLLKGKWSKDDYQLHVTVTFAGAPRSLRIKSGVGTSFIFDYDTKDKAWDGSKSFEAIVGDTPATNAACKASFE